MCKRVTIRLPLITGYKNVGDLVFMVPAGYKKMLLAL